MASIKKTVSGYDSFVAQTQFSLDFLKIKCKLRIQFDSAVGSKINSIEIDFHDTNGYTLEIDPPLAQLFGFTQTIFQNGKYTSTLPISEEDFDKIAVNDLVGAIQTFKNVEKSVKLGQFDHQPSAEDLAFELVRALGEADVTIGCTVDTDQFNMNIDVYDPRTSIQMSRFLNFYLGFAPDETFAGDTHNPIHPSAITGGIILPPTRPDPGTNLLCMSNIVENQPFGSRELPLLRVMPRAPQQIEQHEKEFSSIIYVQAKPSKFTHITLSLISDTQQYASPSSSPTTAVLHFKRRL